jgi:hypothetical protein
MRPIAGDRKVAGDRCYSHSFTVAVMWHDHQYGCSVLDAHYLGRDVQLAEAAVLKLEKRTKL